MADNSAPLNASPLSPSELPDSLQLTQDYITTLIADPTQRETLDTPSGCEFSCNDGFKI